MFKLQHKDKPSRSLWLVGERITLGRNADNDWVLDGLGVEDLHAEILIYPNFLILKSAEGSCFVNSVPVVDEHQLNSGDELRIANERLLIIDPKTIDQQKKVTQAKQPVTDEEGSSATIINWSLIPDHPKLQDRDFSILNHCVLGRSKECEFSIPYKLLSREHASLTVIDNDLVLEDLGSSNGSFVNGNPVQKITLKEGDKVSFAKLSFRVQSHQTTVESDVDDNFKYDSNKTAIRPAVDINSALVKEQIAKSHPEPQGVKTDDGSIKETSTELSDNNESVRKTSSNSTWRWIIMAGIIILIGLWFSPFNPW